jgi:Flp pilus assembly protein TadG
MAQTMQNRMLNLRDSLRHFIRLITGDRKGASAVMTALMLPVIVGFVGLAIDVGVWQVNKRKLQGVVDQAVYSAAMAAYSGATVAQATIEAKAVFAQAGLVDGVGGVAVTVSNPATSGAYTANSKSWQVTATMTQQLYFSGLFLNNAPTLSTRGVALQGYSTTSGGTVTTTAGTGCTLTLDTTAQYATEVTNNGAVSVSTCALFTNSNHASALGCYNNCTVASNTYTVGGVYNAGSMTGTNYTNQTAVADPYRTLTTPTTAKEGSCLTSTKVVAGSGATTTISAGRYCGGIDFKGSGKTLVMNAGTYYVESIFNIGTGATLNATAGVTIVIIGSYCLGDTNNTCQHPDEGIAGTFNVTAPTSNTSSTTGDTNNYKGVALYMSNSTYRQHQFANGSTINVQGTLYAPAQKFSFNNNSTISSSKCMKIVSLRLTINNNGQMRNNCTGTGVSTIGDTTSTTAGSTTTYPTSMVE